MQIDYGAWKSPVFYRKTFNFVKSICVKADGALGIALLHFDLYVPVK